MPDATLSPQIVFALHVADVVRLASAYGTSYSLGSVCRERSGSSWGTPFEAHDLICQAIKSVVPTRERREAAYRRMMRIAAGKAAFTVSSDESEAQEVGDAEAATMAAFRALRALGQG